jgi:hypothetical protein
VRVNGLIRPHVANSMPRQAPRAAAAYAYAPCDRCRRRASDAHFRVFRRLCAGRSVGPVDGGGI